MALSSPAPRPTGEHPAATVAALTWPPSLPHPLARRLRTARDLLRQRSEAAPSHPLATGVEALDRLLGGGLPRGELVEVTGHRSGGRYSLVLAALAAATAGGEAAALVDLGDALDPQVAVAAGVELERLLWLRPPRLREALAAAEAVLDAGFPLVALDLGQPPVPGGRGPEAAWTRLSRAAAAHGGALLVSTPYRASGAAASAVLAAGRGRAQWRGTGRSPRLLAGTRNRLWVEKLRGRRPNGEESVRWRSGELPDGLAEGV